MSLRPSVVCVLVASLLPVLPASAQEEVIDDTPPPVERRRRAVTAPPAEAVEPAAADAEPPPDAEPGNDEGGGQFRNPAKKKKKKKPVEEESYDAPSVVLKADKIDGAQGTRRIQVFLVPVGEASSLAAGPAQLALEAEVAKLPGFRAVDLVEELAVAPSSQDTAKLEEARRVLGDGNKQLVAKQYEDAVGRYRKAIRTMEAAGNALEAPEYADAWARLGIALHLSGEDKLAKDALSTAVRMDAGGMVDGRSIDRKQGQVLDAARAEAGEQGVGVLSVITQPPGARVFVGGVYRGTSPVTVDRVPSGSNILRIDRAGGVPVTQFVEVREGVDTAVRVKVSFSDEAQSLQRALVQVPGALDHEKGVPDMLKAMGRRFRLDRAVFATVEMVRSGKAELRVCVMDYPRDSRLVDDKKIFDVDVEGGLEAAVGKWVRAVLDAADKSRNRSAKDPLDRADGTEGWYTVDAQPKKKKGAEKSTYVPKSTRKEGVKSKDPLDHQDGMEDW